MFLTSSLKKQNSTLFSDNKTRENKFNCYITMANTKNSYNNIVSNYKNKDTKLEPTKKGYIQVGTNSYPNKVYYETYGNGPKKIIFICGYLTPLKSYIKQVDYFARSGEYEICLFDNRGVSQSKNDKLNYSYNFSTKSMAKDALDVVDYLGWKEYHVVGLSMGGMASLKLATLVPNSIKSLTLASIPNGYGIPLFSNGTRLYINGLFMKENKKKIRNFQTLMYSEKYLDELSPQNQKFTRSELMYQKEIQKKESPSFLTQLGHQMGYAFFYLTNKEIDIINKSETPVVYIHGTEDKISTLEHSQRTLANKLNLDSFHILKGGHTINIEKPNEFNKIVENHILKYHHRTIKQSQTETTTHQAKEQLFNLNFYERNTVLKRNNNSFQRNTTLNLFKSKITTFLKFISK